jgi:hypothetical protein
MNDNAPALPTFALIPGGLPDQASDLVAGVVKEPDRSVQILEKPRELPRCLPFKFIDSGRSLDSLLSILGGDYLIRTGRQKRRDIAVKGENLKLIVSRLLSADGLKLPVELPNKKIRPNQASGEHDFTGAIAHLEAKGWIGCLWASNPTNAYDYCYDHHNDAVPVRPQDPTRHKQGLAAIYELTDQAREQLASVDCRSWKPIEPRDPITVKDDNKHKLKPLPSDLNLKTWCREIKEYNKGLKRFVFAFDGRSVPWFALTVHRVFNNSSYDHGGRFYSDFMQLKQETRKQLTIDDEPVISLDFASLHGRIALAVVGYDCPVNRDPYNLEGFDRKLVKKAFTAALNKATGTGAIKDTTHTEDAKQANELNERIIAALVAKYPNLEQVFGRGSKDAGLLIQKADSVLMGYMLNQFTIANRPLLGVHDEFVLLERDRPLLDEHLPNAIALLWDELRKRWPNLKLCPLPFSP